MLHCPYCRTRHTTLRGLLTCCPTELRRLTEILDRHRAIVGNYTLHDLFSGVAIPRRIRQLWLTATEEVSA